MTLSPRCSSRVPSEAAASPFPRELTTPPVTKMCFMRADHTGVASKIQRGGEKSRRARFLAGLRGVHVRKSAQDLGKPVQHPRAELEGIAERGDLRRGGLGFRPLDLR